MYKKFTAALLAFLMIFSMGGMLRPLAQTNTSQAQTSQEPKVNGGNKVYINETNFPDANFRQYLLDNTNYTTDDSGKYYTEDQIAAIKKIDCNGKNIVNLKGIEYFIALTKLDCNYNHLTSLDVSQNTALTNLDCGGQTPNANCYYDITKNEYKVQMKEVLGKNGDLTKVNITSSGWNCDPNTGLATYLSNGNDAPSNLSYNYATDDKGHQLQVNLSLNIES